MAARKRQYYRNWYQEWKRDEEEEKLNRIYELGIPHQYTVDPSQYKANHQLSRQTASNNRQSLKRRQQNQTMDLSLTGENTGVDVLRGLLIGLPLVLVLVTVLYVGGIIPLDTIQSLFGISTVSPVDEYLTQYDELMTLHNEINTAITSHLKLKDFSQNYKQELQTLQQNITTKTNSVTEQKNEDAANLNQLLAYKLLSLNKMIELVVNSEELTTEVSNYYDQFVTDQNEVGTKIVSALTTMLDSHNVKYNKQVNGVIQIK